MSNTMNIDIEEYRGNIKSALDGLEEVDQTLAKIPELLDFMKTSGMENVIKSADAYFEVVSQARVMIGSLLEAAERTNAAVETLAEIAGN